MAINQTDALRAIGRILDGESARRVQLLRDAEALQVWWQAGDGLERRAVYPEGELQSLCEESRQLRCGRRNPSVPALAELLRTLGQSFERFGAEFLAISQERDGFTFTAVARGEAVSHRYSLDLVRTLSRRYRAQRGPKNRPGPSADPRATWSPPTPAGGPAPQAVSTP